MNAVFQVLFVAALAAQIAFLVILLLQWRARPAGDSGPLVLSYRDVLAATALFATAMVLTRLLSDSDTGVSAGDTLLYGVTFGIATAGVQGTLRRRDPRHQLPAPAHAAILALPPALGVLGGLTTL